MEIGLLGALGAGLVSFASPCVLPLVPAYLCFIAGASLDDLARSPGPARTARTFARALAFVLGFGTVFVGLGMGASTLGTFIADHVGALSQAAGIVVVLLGLHMLGAFRLLPLMREARFTPTRRPAGPLGAYVVGLAFAFGWSPCVGPVLAAILMVAGLEEGAGRGAALLLAYTAGIGLPFLGAALFTGPFLRAAGRIKRHLGTIEKGMGLLLVATGILIFMGAMPVLAGWLLDAVPALGAIG